MVLQVLTRTAALTIRPGRRSDELAIAATMARNLMNPLSIDARNFVVATNDDGDRLGFAQLRPLGAAALADPATYDAAPGTYDFDAAADDEAWDELPSIPTGLASLPWTAEYREFAAQAARRRDARTARRATAAVRWRPSCSSCAPVFVFEQHRNGGVGAALVRRLLESHEMADRRAADVYLLTLEATRRVVRALRLPRRRGRDGPARAARLRGRRRRPRHRAIGESSSACAAPGLR
ncbi:GNAT acetyltransferase [Aureococcus anophagefferens]|uniref:GNAT acetyltransferase n=1 Tax=Aureococcus anophagefferens TaxID=44056 RepID=A0ABR1FZV6_AURAN